MKSKSIVQERLDAGRNRLDIITREVDSQRMPAKEVAKGLRQVGILLESVQKFIKTDTDMKFAQPINQRLEIGMNRLTSIINALEGTGMTGNDLNKNLQLVGKSFDSIQEFVELELETLA